MTHVRVVGLELIRLDSNLAKVPQILKESFKLRSFSLIYSIVAETLLKLTAY